MKVSNGVGKNRVDNNIKSTMTTSEGREQELTTVAQRSQLNTGNELRSA